MAHAWFKLPHGRRQLPGSRDGFTLVELLVVIAIIAILVALAVPAYQDYAVRTKVGECVANTASAKLAVAETYQSEGAFPADDAAAGYDYQATTYCSDIVIAGAVVTATTQNTGAGNAGGAEGDAGRADPLAAPTQQAAVEVSANRVPGCQGMVDQALDQRDSAAW